MEKQEALDVMHEILTFCQDALTVLGVSIDKRSSRVFKNSEKEGFSIRMRCELGQPSRDCLKPILENHGLSVYEENGFVIISKIKT